MIYFVTSSISYKTLKERFLSLQDNEAYKFLIYDKFKSYLNEDDLKSKDTKIFLDSTTLDNFINKNFSKDDLLINFDGFHIFSDLVIDKIKKKSANFHPSPLPKYCGVNPINWALLNGENTWGATWHRISEKLDRGEIICQESFTLKKNISQVQLLNLCMFWGLKNLSNVLTSLKSNSILKESENTKEFSLFEGSRQPEIILKSLEDIKKIENIFPITPYEKWRWKFNLNGILITAISTTPTKGNIKFNNTIIFEDEIVYFAD